MPNNKKKALKQVKGLDKAHPYSRKARQMNSIIARKNAVSNAKVKSLHNQQLKINRLLKMAEILKNQNITNSIALIQTYISRNDSEISQLQAQARLNRPKNPRLALLTSLKQKDEAEFKAGMEVPDMNPKNIETLLNWYIQ